MHHTANKLIALIELHDRLPFQHMSQRELMARVWAGDNGMTTTSYVRMCGQMHMSDITSVRVGAFTVPTAGR